MSSKMAVTFDMSSIHKTPQATSRRSNMISQSMKLLNESILPEHPVTTDLSVSLFSLGSGVNDSLLGLEASTIDEFGETRHLYEPSMINIAEDDNSVTSVVTGLFSAFKKRFSDSSSDLLGLVSSYEELCNDSKKLLDQLSKDITCDPGLMASTIRVCELLEEEKQTWRLVKCLFEAHLSRSENSNDSMECSLEYKSEKEIIKEYLENDTQLNNAQIVIDWLEKNESDALNEISSQYDACIGGVSWENTLHLLKVKGAGKISRFVTEMDPDAPLRQGKQIAELDIEDEAKMLKLVFAFIRAGQVYEAQNICDKCGQPWRAATLQGWKLFHDPNMINDSEEKQNTDGNPLRKLWKKTCWSMSNDEKYSSIERALYGLFGGNLKAVLAECRSWSDCVWVYYKLMVDLAIENKLQQSHNVLGKWQDALFKTSPALPNEFWEQNLDLNDCSAIFDEIAASKDPNIREQSKSVFKFAQRCIILGSVDELLNEVIVWIEDDQCEPQLIRFLAHFILFLQSIGYKFDSEKVDNVMEKYVMLLTGDTRTKHLVATYTSVLSKDKQVLSYACLLETIEESEERRQYIALANEAGLDVPTITKTVVERIRAHSDATMESSLSVGGMNDPTVGPGLSSDDRRKTSAIEWLVFDQSQRLEAIKQCNAVVRGFLGAGKYNAVKEICKKIPADSVDIVYKEWGSTQHGDSANLPSHVENTIHEYLCIDVYMAAQEAFVQWFKHFHSKKPQLDEEDTAVHQPSAPFNSSVSMTGIVSEEQRMRKKAEEIAMWENQLGTLCDVATEKIYGVLLFPKGWLLNRCEPDEDSEEEQCRSHQLSLLRQLLIPSLCNLLLTVLSSTGRYEQCGKLANVVASEDNSLFTLFRKAQGKKFLMRVQEALSKCL